MKQARRYVGKLMLIWFRGQKSLAVRITDVESDLSGYVYDHEQRPIEVWFFVVNA